MSTIIACIDIRLELTIHIKHYFRRTTMNKNKFASTPPMGWNSYDYYDTTVNEEQIKANADYMAANMKDSG